MNVIILEDDENRIEKFVSLFPLAKIANNASECIELLKNSDCDALFLDHDLGGEIYVDTNHQNTGSEVVRWIEKNKPTIREIIVHSYNSSASATMMDILTQCGYNAKRIPFNHHWEIIR